MLRYATPFCLADNTSRAHGDNGKTVRNDGSFITARDEALSPLACRQIPQGMLRYAIPFCLADNTSRAHGDNGKTVMTDRSSPRKSLLTDI